MGSPKALLPTPSGCPLAAWQAERLRAAGCRPAAIVLGAEAEAIRRALPGDTATVENPRWAEGRATSLQAGAAAFPDAAGWLFMPVDAVGIRLETLQALLAAAAWNPDVPWRPCHRGEKGNLLWLPRSLGPELAALEPGARIDGWISGHAEILDCDDPALLRNVNTRDAYDALPPGAFTPD
jgi:CTP:molybdopterin cytidylyltransferase MocA